MDVVLEVVVDGALRFFIGASLAGIVMVVVPLMTVTVEGGAVDMTVSTLAVARIVLVAAVVKVVMVAGGNCLEQ